MLACLLPLGARAQYTGNYQTNIISGVVSNWPDYNYSVGTNSYNNDYLIINSGGVLNSSTGYVGQAGAVNSNNIALINGGIWSNTGNFYVGNQGAGNQLIITNGGVVYDTVGRVGNNANASNTTVLVTGANSVWNNTGNLYFGISGQGNQMTIANGGTVVNTTGTIGYNASGSNTTVLVTGAGSSWTNVALYVGGQNGSSMGNQLTISNGGTVYNTTATLGTFTNANNNAVLVTGTNSVWNNTGTLTVGATGSYNQVTINNAGAVYTPTVVLGNMAGANSNALVINGGTLWANTISNGFGTGGTVTLYGGTLAPLNANGTWSSAMALSNTTTFSIADTGGVARTVTVSGILSGSGGLTKMGAGTLVFNNANTYGGETFIGQGALSIAQLSSLPNYANGGFVVSNGATLAVQIGVGDSNIGTLLGTTNFLAGANLGFDSSAGSFSSAAVISNGVNGSLGVAIFGGNAVTLSGANTYSGGTVLSAGGLVLGNVNALGTGPLTNTSSTAHLDASVDLSAGTGVTNAIYSVGPLVISNQNNLTLSGPITTVTNSATGGTGGSLNKYGSANLMLAGTDTLQYSINIYNGTLSLNNGANLTQNYGGANEYIWIGDANGYQGTLNISNGATLTSPVCLILSANGGTGVVNQVGGTITSGGQNRLGQSAGSYAAWNQSGGVATLTNLYLTYGNNTYGVFNLSGGQLNIPTTFTFGNGKLTTNGTAIFNQSGGTATVATLTFAGTTNLNYLNISNGVFRASALTYLAQYAGSTSTLYFGQGAQVTLPALNTTATGGVAYLTFDGGALSNAGAATTSYLQGLTHTYITTNGAIFNVGAAITVSQNLENASAQMGTLIKLGGGTLTLAGANTYSGGTTIGQGVLDITAPGALPNYNANGGFAVSNGAMLAVQMGVGDTAIAGMVATTNFFGGANLGFDSSAGSFSSAAVISNGVNGSLGVVILGTNTVTLSGVNTFSGGLTLNAGTLDFTTNVFGTGTLALNGGTLAADNSLTNFVISNPVTMNGNTVMINTATNVLGVIFSGSTWNLQGTTNLVQGGTWQSQFQITDTITNGTLILQAATGGTGGQINLFGTNNFGPGGGLIISNSLGNGAPVCITNALALGAPGNSLTLDGRGANYNAELQSQASAGNIFIYQPVTALGTVQLSALSGSSMTITNLSGSGTFLYNGSGKVILAGSNSYSGVVQANSSTSANTFEISNTWALANATLVMTNATAAGTGNNNVYFGPGITSVTLGALAGSGSGASNLVLQTLDSTPLAVALSVGNNNSNTTYSGSLIDNGLGSSLTKIGSGTLYLTGSNVFAGGVTISAGTLEITTNLNLGSTTTTLTISNGAALEVNQSAAENIANPITLGAAGGVIHAIGAGTLNINGTITGGSGLTTIGSSVLNSSSSANNLGTLFVSNSTLYVTSANEFAHNCVVTVNNGATLFLDYGAGSYANSNSMIFSSGATLGTRTAALTLTNATLPGGGTMQFKRDNSGGTQPIITENDNWTPLASNLTIIVSCYSPVSNQVFLTLNGVISGNYNVTNNIQNGSLTLNGANTYSGDTVLIGGGTNIIGNALALQNSTLMQSSSDTVQFAAGLTAATFGGLSGTSNIVVQTLNSLPVALTIGGNGRNTTYSGVLSDGGVGSSLIKTGSGSLTLANANTYTGGTVINGGTLVLGANNALPSTGAVFVNGSSSIYNLGVFGTVTNGAIGLDNGGLITNGTLVGSSYAVTNGTITANLGGTGALTKGGSGMVTLSGANTYSGGTVISGGTLQLDALNAFPGNALTINSGAFDQNNYAIAVTTFSGSAGTLTNAGLAVTGGGNFGGAIVGSGALTNTSGMLALSGANTYSGGTVINGGTLQLGAPNAFPGNALTINSGAFDQNGYAITVSTLGGSAGTLTNAGLTVTGGGSFGGAIVGAGGLTMNGAGTLALTGVNSYAGNTLINNGTLALSGSGTLGAGNASVASGATLDLTGVIGGNYTLNTTLTNSGTVAGGLIIGANALATGGGYYANVTVAAGGTLTPGLGGNTNYVGNLTLNAGSTNLFQLQSLNTHDMTVVSNSLTWGGASPLLMLDLAAYTPPVSGTIVLYDNVFSSPGWDGTNQTFQLVDWGAGANSPVLLTNNATFWAVGGGTTTNYFEIQYNFAADADNIGNDIALTVIPEPASVNLLIVMGATCFFLRRRIQRSKGC